MDFELEEEKETKSEPIKLAPKHIQNEYVKGDIWGLQSQLKNAFSFVDEWILIQKPNQDIKIKFIVPQKYWGLFTIHVHNRFLAVFRKHYQNVILLELQTPEAKRAEEIRTAKAEEKAALKRMAALENKLELRKHG